MLEEEKDNSIEKNPIELLQATLDGTDKLPDGAFSSVDWSSISIHVNEDDTEEVKTLKESVEFTMNSVREGVTWLFALGKATRNPRFFETAATLLNTLNSANKDLISIKIKMDEVKKPSVEKIENQTNIHMMTAADAMKNVNPKDDKIIDG